MESARLLAFSFLKDHPDEAAAILEGRPDHEVVALLEEASPELVGALIQRMTASSAAPCLIELPAQQLASVCEGLPLDTLSALLRQMEPEARSFDFGVSLLDRFFTHREARSEDVRHLTSKTVCEALQ